MIGTGRANPEANIHEVLLAVMVDPVKTGDRFTIWPLHLTLLPWFEVHDLRAAEHALRKFFMRFSPFTAQVGERAYFGVHKDLPVRLVELTPQLRELHEAALHFITQQDWELRGRYVGEHFVPHVTQKRGRDASGTVSVDAVYLVEALPQNYGQIVAKLELGRAA